MILAVILLASHIFHLKFRVTFKGFTHYLDLHHGEESQWCPLMSETVHYYLSLNLPFFSLPTLWNVWQMPGWLQSRAVTPHTEHTLGMRGSLQGCGFAAFCLVNAGSWDGHPCKSPCLPQQLTAQSCELKLPVGTGEQNLYTNEIICMKCYFNKTA